MTKTKIEFEVEIPEGYEWTGECRKVLRGEWHLSNEGFPEVWDVTAQSCSRYPILREAEVWKQLTPEKALEFMVGLNEVKLRHKSWIHEKKYTIQRVRKIYYHTNKDTELSIELGGLQTLVCNTEYLEEA